MITEKKYSRKHLDSPDINLTYFLMLWKSLPVVSNFTTFYKFYMYNWIVTKNYDKSFVFLSSAQYHIYRRLNGGWTTSWVLVNWRLVHRMTLNTEACSAEWVLAKTPYTCSTNFGERSLALAHSAEHAVVYFYATI